MTPEELKVFLKRIEDKEKAVRAHCNICKWGKCFDPYCDNGCGAGRFKLCRDNGWQFFE